MNETKVEVFVGTDVSEPASGVCVGPACRTLHVACDEAGGSRIVERLKEVSPTLIAIGATGGLEVRIATEPASIGLPVAAIDPRQARDFAKATGRLAKTDQVDAGVLAAFAKAVRPQARPLEDMDTRAPDEMVSRRRQLIGMRARETRRLNTAVTKPMQKSLLKSIAWSDKRIGEIDNGLTKRLRKPEAWRAKDDLLRSIPGAGNATARTMPAKRPEPGAPNRREIAALTGVAPLANGSGKHRGKRFIWGGRADVRAVLYRAAVPATRRNDTIKAFAERLKKAGKPPKVVVVARMRKLLTVTNFMLKNNTPWNRKTA